MYKVTFEISDQFFSHNKNELCISTELDKLFSYENIAYAHKITITDDAGNNHIIKDRNG